MEIELRHLRAVCAIADGGSLTKAATALGVSQAALTAQLQRIEAEIGGRLFERGRHGAAPTALGEYVLTRARAVLLGVEDLRRGALRHSRSVDQDIWLGGVASSLPIGLADRLSDLLGGQQVHVRTEYSPRLMWELIAAGHLHGAATVDYPGYELWPTPDVGHDLVAVEPVFVALWEGHPLAGRPEVDLADLADEVWALTPPDAAGWPECFLAACGRAGFSARVAHQISEAAPIREMVAARRAVSPCQAVFASGDGVVVKPLVGAPIRMRHLLVWRRDGALAAYADDLVRLTREAYWAHAARRPHYRACLRRHGELSANDSAL